eukprot:jgi/Mesen1/4514/ME000023S03893
MVAHARKAQKVELPVLFDAAHRGRWQEGAVLFERRPDSAFRDNAHHLASCPSASCPSSAQHLSQLTPPPAPGSTMGSRA